MISANPMSARNVNVSLCACSHRARPQNCRNYSKVGIVLFNRVGSSWRTLRCGRPAAVPFGFVDLGFAILLAARLVREALQGRTGLKDLGSLELGRTAEGMATSAARDYLVP